MLGCGVPVCALGFASLGELIRPGVNGETFSDSTGLCQAIRKLLRGFPTDGPGSDAPRRYLPGTETTWQRNWAAVVAPCLVR